MDWRAAGANPAALLLVALVCLVPCLAGCAGGRPASPVAGAEAKEGPEAISLLGKPLFPPELPAETRARLQSDLERAREAHQRDPHDEDATIWLGRRLGYLGLYREAIEVYTRGLADHPRSYRLLRHRGHRFITIRRFDDAIADLDRAAALIEGVPDEVEPDGAPNPSNIPRSTSHSNIWYHLGLAHYLKRDFEKASRAYRACMTFSSVNDDMLCATSHWLYMSLRRAGRHEEARAVVHPIRQEMEILESFAYHKLLLLYQGRLSADAVMAGAGGGTDLATIGYGVGNWYFCFGDTKTARENWEQIVEGTAWAAFGHIAAEAELVTPE